MAFEKRDATLFISLHEHKHPAINDMHFYCVCTRLAKKKVYKENLLRFLCQFYYKISFSCCVCMSVFLVFYTLALQQLNSSMIIHDTQFLIAHFVFWSFNSLACRCKKFRREKNHKKNFDKTKSKKMMVIFFSWQSFDFLDFGSQNFFKDFFTYFHTW